MRDWSSDVCSSDLGDIRESAEENPFTNLLTGREPDLSLRDLLKSIRHAKEQESVKGIYLDMGVFSGGTASLATVPVGQPKLAGLYSSVARLKAVLVSRSN